MLVALGLSDRAGGYREVEGAGYARAAVAAGVAVFPTAQGTWGVVRAYALDGGEWAALARPVMVEERQRATFDLATRQVAVVAVPARRQGAARPEERPAGAARAAWAIDRGQ